MTDSAPINESLSRRAFLQASVAAGGGLLMAAALPLALRAAEPTVSPSAKLNAWVRISSDNVVTLQVSQSEMGQGVMTTLPAVLADELGADWAAVRIEFSPFAADYQHPVYRWMFTGNSESISAFHDLMRQMGAAAREMMIAAAAQRLRVPAAELTVERSRIIHRESGRTLTFGQIATAAAALPVPAHPRLRALEAQQLVGRSLERVDAPSKIDGSAVFGIDVSMPDLLNAAISMCPTFDGTVRTYDRASVLASPGVVAAVDIPGGLAVVGDTYWRARRGLDRAAIVWDTGPRTSVSSASMRADYARALSQGPFRVRESKGEATAALRSATNRIEALYYSPFQAHAAMEPINCTARVSADRCDIWAPTQGVELAHLVAKQVTGLPDARITIHRTLLGGGFGRRLHADFIKQALLVAMAVGRPVKILWSREEDMAHDFYRPAVLHSIAATVDARGRPSALHHRIVAPSMLRYVFPRSLTPDLKDATQPLDPPQDYDEMTTEGVRHTPYQIEHYLVEEHRLTPAVPVSVWRTTGHGPHNFAFESFVDELAIRARRDPLDFRLELLASHERAYRVAATLKERTNWGAPLSRGVFRGVAFAHAFGGYIAQAVELSVVDSAVKIHRVVSVADIGRVLDPRICEANIQGGVVWGLSALRTAITFDNGRALETNFHKFAPLHLWETPRIEAYFIDSAAAPTGAGEIGPVPTLAACCNAVFAATGTRIRELPLSTVRLTLA